ncbi:hypothetical protein CDA63_19630 [Hymenobacter amundsenii]|uniref:Uncharacterized protein n=1 Tax=Hymenobacter amundsenii TaxID=2006685 RepID=A0A246FFX4_9BACT|nr:hypothetical protein [Hymenobacter amundsenii]OWP61406.1 hypothetical protein CDA63_19630 [Hymenobacter amundsenii]
MHLLAENDDALRLLTSSETLLNATVEGFAVRYERDGLVAEVVFQLQHSQRVNRLLLRFKRVRAYAFAYSEDVSFYNVESFKFLRVATGYYLSLDPVDERDQADECDNDTIQAEGIQVYKLTPSESN